MSRSIRWTLILWYGVILVAVVAGFGGFMVANQRALAFEAIDSELEGEARGLAAAIEMDEEDGLEIYLREEYAGGFSEGHFFIIWLPNGKVLASSTGAPELPKPAVGTVEVDQVRRVTVEGPDQTTVMVAGSAAEAHRTIDAFTTTVYTVGGGVLLLALLGGWFLAGLVLKPIEKISATASSISGKNLGERIDVGMTESELGRLAGTLNEMFGRLQAAFERQARFTADASHELRTPLSVVSSNAEVALRKKRTPGEYREALETCLRAAKRMKSVVEGLLTLARSDGGKIELKQEPVELRGLIEETASLLRPIAEQRGVSIDVSTQEARVTGDADRLREVLMNLASNAIEYNKEGGKVDVRVEQQNGDVHLSVTDTGIGIPEKEQSQIFERFYRVDKARSRELGGNGLGLAITKWIVEAHGGEISVQSRIGEGSTFTVRLPAS